MNVAWFGTVPKRVIIKCITSWSDATHLLSPYYILIKLWLIKMKNCGLYTENRKRIIISEKIPENVLILSDI